MDKDNKTIAVSRGGSYKNISISLPGGSILENADFKDGIILSGKLIDKNGTIVREGKFNDKFQLTEGSLHLLHEKRLMTGVWRSSYFEGTMRFDNSETVLEGKWTGKNLDNIKSLSNNSKFDSDKTKWSNHEILAYLWLNKRDLYDSTMKNGGLGLDGQSAKIFVQLFNSAS